MTGTNDPELVGYATALRRWLQEHAAHYQRGEGPTSRIAAGGEQAAFAEARRFQAKLYAAGYAGITVPPEYGGQGRSDEHQQVFDREASQYDLPNQRLGVSVNVIGEVLLALASHEQRATHVPRILSGEEVWLQLLSEPSAGSDLASLVTRATLEGDHYALNGEKTWSTGAAAADYALCAARTDWTVPKHQGITVFIVDLRSRGIEIRPIKQIDGGVEFCQEYLTDVQVPATSVVGSVNAGWTVVRRLLEIEHKWSGRRTTGRRAPGDVRWLVALARERGRTGDPAVRKLIASVHAQLRAHELLAARVSREVANGSMSPSYGALLKISNDSLVQHRAEVALRLAGARALAWSPEDDHGAQAAHAFLNSRSASIAGGTTEIQRNNFSERALGLPREVFADRDLPFNQVPHN
jgi:alkylation response protein AidB-like acyl-CoA dehydrogenase